MVRMEMRVFVHEDLCVTATTIGMGKISCSLDESELFTDESRSLICVRFIIIWREICCNGTELY